MVTTVVFSTINRHAISTESSACTYKGYLIVIAVLPILCFYYQKRKQVRNNVELLKHFRREFSRLNRYD